MCDETTLEPDGKATGCNPVEVGSTPTSVSSGPWAFWKGAADVRVVEVDIREATLDVPGQEIIGADAENPTLMRMRELEVLEKIVASGKLSVILGEKGLADRVVNLIWTRPAPSIS